MKEMVGGCCVCSDEQGSPENPLVYCDGDGCTVAVHQACYGIITVPQGPWFCRRCESQERAAKVRCELCPQRDGALKRTDSGGWAHVICALYIPEVRFGNVSTMEPIMLGLLPPDRYHKSCYICESKGKESKASFGACMQCNKSTCKNYFHVTCAQAEGLLCEEAGNYNDNVKYCGYCSHHYKKILESSEKVPSKDSKRFTLVTSRKDYPNIKPIPAFRPIPSSIPGLKSPEVEKNKPFNSSLSSSSSSLSSSSSSLSSFKQSIGSSEKYGGKSKGEDKFSRTNSTDKLFHDKDRKSSDDKNKDKDSLEKDESSKKKSSKSSKDHHHSTGSKSDKGSKVLTEKDKEKTSSSSSSSSNAMSSVTSLTTSNNCTGLTSLSTLNDLNSTSRPFDDRPSGQFSLSSFIDPKLASKNQSKKAAEKDAKTSMAASAKDKVSSSSTKELAKSSNSTFGTSANGGHSSSKLSNSKLDSTSGKSKDSAPSDSKSVGSSSKNTHEKYVDKKGPIGTSGHNASSSSSKRKSASDVKTTSTSKSSSSAKKRKRMDSSSSSSSDSEEVEDEESTDDSDAEGDIKNRKITSNKTKGKADESKANNKSRTKKMTSSKSTAKGNKKADSSYVNGTSGSKAKSVNGTKQVSVVRKKKSKRIISSDEDEDEDDETKSESLEEDNSSNGTEPNLDDVEPKPKSKKSSLKESSSASTGGTGGGGSNRQERRVINKSNGYILPSPSPSLTPMTNKNAPTGHNVDMDRVICQPPPPPPPPSSSFAIPPPPTSRVNRESQVKEGPTSLINIAWARAILTESKIPTEPPASSLEALLERQWAQGAHFILDQAQHYDIASLLSCLSQLRQDNERLEERLRQLTSRREHLLAVNARLALPLNGSFNTSHGSLSTTANASSSSSSLPSSSSPFLPPPPQPPIAFQQLLNAAAVLQTPSNSVSSYEHSSRNSSTRSSALGDGSNSNIAINGTRYGNDSLSNFYGSTGLADGTASPSHHALHGSSSSRPSSRSSPYGSGVNSL